MISMLMQTLMMKNVMIAILMIIVDDCGQSMKIVANWGYQSSTLRHLLRMQRSSGQVIPPTNSKVAHPPNSACPIPFKFLNSPEIASIRCFLQFSVVSGPIFAANLFNFCSGKSICNAQSIRRTATNIEHCIIKHKYHKEDIDRKVKMVEKS